MKSIINVIRPKVLFLCVILAYASCSNNETFEVSRDTLGLQGCVKFVTETAFDCKYRFGHLDKGDHEKRALITNYPCTKRFFEFGKRGEIVKIITHNADFGGTIEQVCRYDKKGFIADEVASRVFARYNIVLSYNRYNDSFADSLVNRYDGYSSHIPAIDFYNICIHHDQYSRLGLIDCTQYHFLDTTVVLYYRDNQQHTSSINGVYHFANDGDIVIGSCGFNGLATDKDTSLIEEYDEEGRIKLRDLPSGGKIGYLYDEWGNLFVETHYNANGDTESVTVNEYNAKGQLLFRGIQNESSRESITYTYNNQGQVIRSSERYIGSLTNTLKEADYLYDKAGLLLEVNDNKRRYYTHDSLGRLSRITWGSNEEGPYTDIIYIPNKLLTIKGLQPTSFDVFDDVETTYDDHGNWIGKLCIRDGVGEAYYQREIEYYNK